MENWKLKKGFFIEIDKIKDQEQILHFVWKCSKYETISEFFINKNVKIWTKKIKNAEKQIKCH